jgi:hypothetical protein
MTATITTTETSPSAGRGADRDGIAIELFWFGG